MTSMDLVLLGFLLVVFIVGVGGFIVANWNKED